MLTKTQEIPKPEIGIPGMWGSPRISDRGRVRREIARRDEIDLIRQEEGRNKIRRE
jgi:hypothetical protein